MGGAVALITIKAQKTHDASVARAQRYELGSKGKRAIKDGLTNNGTDLISDDGQIGNPKVYTTAGELIFYLFL